MPLFTTTLTTAVSSVPGASKACALNWLAGQPSAVSVMATTNTSAFWNIQFTLDDIERTPSSLVGWQGLSSVPGTALATTYASSTNYPDGSLTVFSGPVGAVRVNSTGLGGVLTIRVMQGESR